MADKPSDTPGNLDQTHNPRKAQKITPTATGEIPFATRAIMVSSGGDVEVELIDQPGGKVVLPSLSPGTQYSGVFTKIFSGKTTAGDIIIMA